MSLMPGQYNLDPMILGAVWEPNPFCLTVSGVAKDLTGCTVTMEIYNAKGNLVDTLTAGDGLLIDANGGIITAMRTIQKVLEYEPGKHSYHLWIVEVDTADKNRWVEGYLEVRA